MKHLESILGKPVQWWKFLLMFLIVFIAANIIGSIPLVMVIVVKVMSEGGDFVSTDFSNLSKLGIDQNLILFLMLIPFVISLVVFALLVKPFHHQTLKEVINGTGKIRWNKFLYGFGMWFVFMSLYLIVDMFFNRNNFILNFSVEKFIPLLIIAVVLIPFQTSFEEVMFRGYLSQGVAAWTRNRLMVIIFPALLFGLMHVANPEVEEYGFWITMPQYVIFGLVFGLVTVLDDGIELAMGAHTANNVFLSVFVTFKASALPTSALFMQKELDPVKDLISLIVISVLFVFILHRKYRWDIKVIFKKVEKE